MEWWKDGRMEGWRGRLQFGNLVTEDLAVRKAERARSRRPEVAEGKFSPQRHRGLKGRKKVFAKGIGDAVTAGGGGNLLSTHKSKNRKTTLPPSRSPLLSVCAPHPPKNPTFNPL